LSSTIGNPLFLDFRLRIALQKYNFFQYCKHFRENFSSFVVFSLVLRLIGKRFRQ